MTWILRPTWIKSLGISSPTACAHIASATHGASCIHSITENNWTLTSPVPYSTFFTFLSAFTAGGAYAAICAHTTPFVSSPSKHPISILNGAFSWILVNVLTPHPANDMKFVMKLSCPVLLVWKFSTIWGNLARKKMACWQAYSASKTWASSFPPRRVGVKAQ